MQDKKREIDLLCVALLAAKQAETEANARRIELEETIIEIVGKPDEGVLNEDGDEYKIKIEQRIIRKLDEKAWAIVADQIPEALRPVTVKETLTVETKGVRWLKDNEPGYYKLLCSAMEEKPAKPSVKVEVVK